MPGRNTGGNGLATAASFAFSIRRYLPASSCSRSTALKSAPASAAPRECKPRACRVRPGKSRREVRRKNAIYQSRGPRTRLCIWRAPEATQRLPPWGFSGSTMARPIRCVSKRAARSGRASNLMTATSASLTPRALRPPLPTGDGRSAHETTSVPAVRRGRIRSRAASVPADLDWRGLCRPGRRFGQRGHPAYPEKTGRLRYQGNFDDLETTK